MYSLYIKRNSLGFLIPRLDVCLRTEVLTNCHSDPHWQQPVVLKLVPEPGVLDSKSSASQNRPGLYLRVVACSDVALNVTRSMAIAWQ